MLEMHDASSLESEEEVAQWRGRQQVFPSSAPAGEAVRFQRLPEEEQPKDTIKQVILRRGSTVLPERSIRQHPLHWTNSQPFSIAPRTVFRPTSLSPPARSSTIFI